MAELPDLFKPILPNPATTLFDWTKKNVIEPGISASQAELEAAEAAQRSQQSVDELLILEQSEPIQSSRATGRGSRSRKPLKRTGQPTEILRYPYDAITDETDYLELRIVNYEAIGTDNKLLGRDRRFDPGSGTLEVIKNQNGGTTSNRSLFEKRRPLRQNGMIFLPIPSNIQDGNSVDFSDSKLDGLTANVASAIIPVIKADGIADVGQKARTALENLTGDAFLGEAGDYFSRLVAAEAANIPFGGNITAQQLLARESGEILNPNMELLFNGVKLRSFKFSFKFTPRSDKEGRVVRSIIHTLKRNMAPSGVSGLRLQTPNIFELTYRKGQNVHPYLNKFKQCALTDMSVNYTGENMYSTYYDGSPVSYIVDLGFKELEPLYQEDYYTDDGDLSESTPQGY